jgi:chromosome segregation protein
MERLEEIRTAKNRLQAEYAAARTRQDEAQTRLDALYEENDRFSLRMQENDTSQEQTRQEIDLLTSRCRDQQSALELLRTNIRNRQDAIAELVAELERQDSRQQDAQAEIDAQKRRLEELDNQIAGLEAELEELLEKARSAADSAGAAGNEISALQAGEALASDAAARGREHLAALEAAQEQMTARQEAVRQELSSVQNQLEAVRKDTRNARRALEDAQEDAAAAANVIQGHTLRMEGQEKRAQDAASALMKLTMEQNNLDSRIRMLAEMEKEYEGFSKAVKLVMQASERGALHGVHGPVASLMKADGKYAVALETALGAGMQNIVVDREEDAKGAIQFLKQRDGGRATFLPITAIRGDELRERGVEQEPGFVDIASRLIRCHEKYDAIFKNLLGRTVVAEDLDCGIAMARKYQNRFRIVTLDGQVINRGGSMTGGSVSRSAGVLSRANELAALKERQTELAEHLAAAQREKDEASRELSAVRYELQVAEGQRRAAEDAVLKGQGEVKQCEVLLEGVRTNEENLEGEQEALTQRLAGNCLQQQTVRQEVAAHEAEAAALRQSAREKLAGQTDLQAYTNRLGGEMSQRKEQLAGLRAQRTAGAEALERMEQTRRDLAGDREQRLARIAAYREEIASGEAETARCTEESASLRLQTQERQDALKALQETRLRLEQERTAMGQKLKESNDALLEAEREASRLEQKLNTGGMEEKQILDKLWESYELSHSAAMEQQGSPPRQRAEAGDQRAGDGECRRY